MKLYREVTEGKARYCAWPMTKETMHEDHIPIEPIEITEEEIIAIAKEWTGLESEDDICNDIELGIAWDGVMAGMEAILSKLKGE